ncbi:MAG: Fic family protein [Oscillospiraceae bacterium]
MDKYEEAITKWQGQKLVTESDYKAALSDFETLFAYHSGKLDNNSVTFSDTREIFEQGTVSDYTGFVSTLREIWNYKKCCDLIRMRLCEGRALSVDLTIDFFETLAQGLDDVSLEQPLPDDKERLKDVIDEVCAYEGTRVLKAGTYLHAATMYLAPFGNYSGRVARVIQNYYLMTRSHPPIIVYSFDKDIYEDCIERFAEMEELNPLYKFLQYETEKLWVKSNSYFESVV